MKRCPWSESTEMMREYHDTIWGVPEYEDQRLYRKLMLDINQAGLSWQTILNKSQAFDEAYDQFELEKIAKYDEEKNRRIDEQQGDHSQSSKNRSGNNERTSCSGNASHWTQFFGLSLVFCGWQSSNRKLPRPK